MKHFSFKFARIFTLILLCCAAVPVLLVKSHTPTIQKNSSHKSISDTTGVQGNSKDNLTIGFSTFLGGINLDAGIDIAVDQQGNSYVTGFTNSTNFPTKNAFQSTYGGGSYDIYIAKFNSTGSLVFSTYFGGSGSDDGTGIAVDKQGNSYIAGFTNSKDFPTKNAFQTTYGGGSDDAFIAKFNSTGSLVFSTYLGGEGIDQAGSIAVDSQGNCYVTGATTSIYFPTKAGYDMTLIGYYDVFISKFNSNGGLIFSSYLGGSSYNLGYGIAVDSQGNSYVTGATYSGDFPTKEAYNSTFGGNFDVFLTKFNSSGKLIFSTYLGGTGFDVGLGIAVDSQGNSYITGYTLSNNFPTKNAYDGTYTGVTDAFVSKFNSTCGLVYSTYFGGNHYTYGSHIAVDSQENSYIIGYTNSTDIPVKNAFQTTYGGGLYDAFVAKFNSNSNLVFSSYFGGAARDVGAGIAVDSQGNSYVSGMTESNNFPTKNAFQPNLGGVENAFLIKIDAYPSILASPSSKNINIVELASYSFPLIIIVAVIVIGSYLVIEYKNYSKIKNSIENNNYSSFKFFLKKRKRKKIDKNETIKPLSDEVFEKLNEIEKENE